MSTHAYCVCPRGSNSVRGIARGPKADEVLVTVHNDGVVCYNTIRQEQASSWALGSQHLRFVTAAVFGPSSKSYYAVVQQASVSGSNTQTLLSWPAATSSGSLEQLARRNVLAGNVHSLHPIPVKATSTRTVESEDSSSSSSVALVYSDGRVAFGAEDSQELSTIRPAGCRVLSATTDADTLAVVCTLKGTGSQQIELYDLQGGSVLRHDTIAQPAENATLTSVSFRDQQLICLWSTGLLQAYSTAAASIASDRTALRLQTSRQLLGFASTVDHLPDNQLQQSSLTLSGKDPKSGKKRRKPAMETADVNNSASPAPFRPCLLPLGGHSVAALRESTDLPTNGHQASGLEAVIVDSLFGTVQSITSVKLPKSATADGAQNGSETMQQGVLQLQNSMGDLVLLFNDAVWSMSIKVQPATLASLVGALNLRSINSNPAAKAAVRALGEDECTSSSTPPQLEYARPAWTQSLAQSREASSSGYHSQAPLAIPATVRWQLDASTQHAQLLEQQLTQQLTAGWTDQEACRSFIANFMKSCRESKLHLSTVLVATTAALLAKQQWWGALDALLQGQALPSLVQCPGLILAIVKGGHFSILTGMLAKAKDMPKGELVAILQLLLSPATAAMDSQFRQHSTRLRNSAVVAVESAEKACLAHIRSEGELSTIDTALQDRVVKAAYEAAAVDGLTAQEVCMHPFVTMTLDSSLLLSSLRQLSLPQALRLAEYLLKLMSKYSGNLSDTMPASLETSKSQLRIPKLQQVLEWLAMLFDAHITSFHRQPGSVKVISQLQGLVQKHIGLVQQMSVLRGITEHLTSKSAVPFANQQSDSLYSVEMLDFRIL